MDIGGNTPYDDAWHLMGIRATRIFLYPINKIFHTNFPLTTPITARPNEITVNGRKLITDVCFQVGDADAFDIFILEEQTKLDKTIHRRLLSYIFSHAVMLTDAMIDAGRIVLPRAAVVNLRGRQEPVTLPLYVEGKHLCDLTLGVLNLRDYQSTQSLADSGLYCLLPYYDSLKKSHSQGSCADIDDILNKAVASGNLELGEAYLLNAVQQGLHTVVRERTKQAADKEAVDVLNLEQLVDGILERDQRNRNEGITQGENRLGKLMGILLGIGKNQDALNAATNPVRRMELYREYGIV